MIQLTPDIAKINKANFILTAIDVFTRKIWASMVKTKSARDIVPVFEKILLQMTRGPSGKMPKAILVDRGLEWLNKDFKNLLKSHDIKLIHNFTSYKASHVERVQRTLQKKIHSFIMSRGNKLFSDRLHDFVDGYNRSFHRSIQMAPMTAENDLSSHFRIRWEQAKYYSKFQKSRKKPRFKVGQICRAAFDRTVFSRGYDQSFSNELYKISSIKTNLPILRYTIKPVTADPDEPDILGTWYQNELQEVGDTEYYTIDKIIKRLPNSKALVSWQGFSDEFNSIVPMSQIKTFKELNEAN